MSSTRDFTLDESVGAFTHLDFKNDPNEFQFAIITDNAGGARDGVFAQAVEMLNLLQPEFVVNAGDLIEGYSEDIEQLQAEWAEIDSLLARLEMPFFFTPGNHDIFSETSVQLWKERFSSEQPYYHFIYKNVLFLIVDTEDPPKTVEDLQRDNPELYEKIAANYPAMEELQAKEHKTLDDGKKLLELAVPVEDWLGEVNISEAQVAYFKEALQSNPEVRWTFVFTHSPPHNSPTIGEKDPGNFSAIEDLLGNRDYTVFSAHTHTYHYEERDGHDFITTATSGAINLPRPGAMDHIVWVTMTQKGPKIVNLLMNGLMTKEGPPGDDPLEHIGLYHPRS